MQPRAQLNRHMRVSVRCGLTPRSSRPATAGSVSLVRGTWCIIAYQAYAACLRGRLNSNVRHHARSGGHDGRNPNSHEAASPQLLGTVQRMQVLQSASPIRPISRCVNESVIEPRRRSACGRSPSCRTTSAAGAMPNRSVNLTRSGTQRKPGPRALRHHRVPGLRCAPPRAGYLER
jgi:hypothetical protein